MRMLLGLAAGLLSGVAAGGPQPTFTTTVTYSYTRGIPGKDQETVTVRDVPARGPTVDKTDGKTRWLLDSVRLSPPGGPLKGDTITDKDGVVWVVTADKPEQPTGCWGVVVTKKEPPKKKP